MANPDITKSDIDKKIDAALESRLPKVSGRLVSANDTSVVIKSADAVIEVPVHHIASRAERGDQIELTLTNDAHILVGGVVSVQKGFVGDNIFGPLTPGILADNCNCNCNCGSIQETASTVQASRLRQPFDGGKRADLSEA